MKLYNELDTYHMQCSGASRTAKERVAFYASSPPRPSCALLSHVEDHHMLSGSPGCHTPRLSATQGRHGVVLVCLARTQLTGKDCPAGSTDRTKHDAPRSAKRDSFSVIPMRAKNALNMGLFQTMGLWHAKKDHLCSTRTSSIEHRLAIC